MKKAIFLILLLFILSGCSNNVTLKHDMTLESFHPIQNSNFVHVTFSDDKEGNKVFVIHNAYVKKLHLHEAYDFKVRGHHIFRPDDEIISVNLYHTEKW